MGFDLKSLIQGGITGIADSASNIITKFKADPTKVAEAEFSLEQLKISSSLEANRIANQILEINEKEIEARLKDTQNARDTNTQIQLSDKASWWAKNTGYFLDVFIGAIWGSITLYLFARAMKLVDNEKVDLTAVLSLYSTVTAVFMICVNFHRGTSAGSKEKASQIDKMIAKMN